MQDGKPAAATSMYEEFVRSLNLVGGPGPL
jgi:hypothetical protein